MRSAAKLSGFRNPPAKATDPKSITSDNFFESQNAQQNLLYDKLFLFMIIRG